MIRTVHGKSIELTEDLGVAEGQAVEVQMRIVSADKTRAERIQCSAGALADEWTAEDDRILEQIYLERSSAFAP